MPYHPPPFTHHLTGPPIQLTQITLCHLPYTHSMTGPPIHPYTCQMTGPPIHPTQVTGPYIPLIVITSVQCRGFLNLYIGLARFGCEPVAEWCSAWTLNMS